MSNYEAWQNWGEEGYTLMVEIKDAIAFVEAHPVLFAFIGAMIQALATLIASKKN